MERQGLSGVKTIYNRIENIERMLLDQVENLKINIKTSDKELEKKEKYCVYHTSRSHLTQE